MENVTVHVYCGCQCEIQRLQDEKEDLLDALQAARQLLGAFYTSTNLMIMPIDRVIERYGKERVI